MVPHKLTFFMESITYTKTESIFRIHLNNAANGNSLTIPEFGYFAELLEKADNDEDTTITLITASGTFFSTGANIKYISKLVDKDKQFYLSEISAKNLYLVHLLLNHHKLLVCALNGPVIGLMASFVCLCDLVYAINIDDIYMSFPFTQIKLTTEGGVSASLTARIGLSKALEVICLSRKLKCKEMLRLGLINKAYFYHNTTTFNDAIVETLTVQLKGLDPGTLIENKKLIKYQFRRNVEAQLVQETMRGLDHWTANDPQKAFAEMIKNHRRSKL